MRRQFGYTFAAKGVENNKLNSLRMNTAKETRGLIRLGFKDILNFYLLRIY
jgi:hypothetical protein